MKYKVFNKLTNQYDNRIIVGGDGTFYRLFKYEGAWPMNDILNFDTDEINLYDKFESENKLDEYYKISDDIENNGPGKYLRIEMEKENEKD